MPSPFPGMNPYLEHEEAWHNFHEQFPAAVVAALEPQVGPNYFVKVDEHIFIHELPEERRRFWGLADVAIRQTTSAPPDTVATAGATAVRAAPRQVLLPAVETVRLSFVEVRDRRTRRVVTIIELLSPSNKQPGPDRDQYLAKRGAVLASPTHLVEIDLLRGGPRMPLAEELVCDYCVLVSRAVARPHADLYSVALRDPLPPIPIPLGGDHPEPVLDLQRVLNDLYDAGGYGKFIYEASPDPPLAAVDDAWARTLLPSGAV